MNQDMEAFIKSVYQTVVQEGMADYKEMYQENVNPDANDYTACIALYQKSSEADQKRMMQMSGTTKRESETIETDGELQDTFLGYLEDHDLHAL